MTPSPPQPLARQVIDACLALGFASAGITPASRTSREPQLREWLADSKHGKMTWMTELLDERLDPTCMLPGARAIIMVADQYAQGAPLAPDEDHARIARYARGRDYHGAIKRRLHKLADALRNQFPGHEFRSFVDTGPVLEREHAARAGLGWIGKHTLLIHPDRGSYLLLGGMATTLDLLESAPLVSPIPDHCGTCTRCIDACPTGAITPYSIDARRCISYLTIEHSSPIDPALEAPMGETGWVFGCDICQDVCPYNTPGRSSDVERIHPAYQACLEPRTILQLLDMTDDEIAHWRQGTALKRATPQMIRRNAVIAARWTLKCSKNDVLAERIERLAVDVGASDDLRACAKRTLSALRQGDLTRENP